MPNAVRTTDGFSPNGASPARNSRVAVRVIISPAVSSPLTHDRSQSPGRSFFSAALTRE